VPFTIYLADGRQVRVPTLDHIFVFPTGSRVIVTKDDDTWEILSPLLMSRIAVDSGADAGYLSHATAGALHGW
jgi:hypothetical protein